MEFCGFIICIIEYIHLVILHCKSYIAIGNFQIPFNLLNCNRMFQLLFFLKTEFRCNRECWKHNALYHISISGLGRYAPAYSEVNGKTWAGRKQQLQQQQQLQQDQQQQQPQSQQLTAADICTGNYY